ncbi:MAG: OmpA family protein [Rubrivivax sp.]|nr:MAG: OmpA family protein [Rubrivivax sp.]
MKQKSIMVPAAGLLAALVATLSACSNVGQTAETASGAPVATAPSPTSTARMPSSIAAAVPGKPAVEKTFTPPPPIKFEDAVARAGAQLFQDAKAELGDEPRPVVVDPLIDANTGAQTESTEQMGKKLESVLKARQVAWKVKPLTRQTLADQPLLLIGTLTPVNIERSIDKQPDAFRIWLTLIDLRTNRVVAKQLDRSTVESVNAKPLRYFSDSPTWHKDKTVLGYINSCQVNTKIGDMADPEYLARLPAAAVINEAMMAYNVAAESDNKDKLLTANRLYKEAQNLADPGDLRVLNGLYLTSWQLGQRDQAQQAFGKLVASGLEAKKLPIKLLFKPGGTTFNDVGDLSTQYQIWLSSIAQEASNVPACVKIVGHTSRTGSASVNEKLSLRRAEAVAKLLESRNRSLTTRLTVGGAGSREALVGLGTDDVRDALDRRVEFRVVDCI